LVQGHDVTDEVDARERHQLLIDELNHRVKNTLAVVQSLAAQSFREVEGSEDARTTFEARLKALSAAHTLLTESSWKSARLAETIRNSVEATVGQMLDRVSMDGPDIALPPQTSVSLAMIVHELSTNAIKYGALSEERGQVAIAWRIEPAEDRRQFIIDWVESDGPPVAEPSRRGFGTRLIQHGMAGERASSVSMHFEPGGLRCHISALLPQDES
jgi:two-component sensor histidine kinase